MRFQMALRRLLSGVVSQQKHRRSSSTSFGMVAELEHEFSQVEHTPIFSQAISKLLLQGEDDQKVILDMTFGSGGHSSLLLDHRPRKVRQIVACDCDRTAFNEAKELKVRHSDRVVPIKSHFHELPCHLLDLGFVPGTFDAILIDTGCSSSQWSDPTRGFCLTKSGPLDLRYAPDPNVPTGSEVLQHIKDRDLLKLLKTYSGLGPNKSKYVANAIIEARYLFHKFQTTRELFDLLKSAATAYCHDQLSKLEFERQRSYKEPKVKGLLDEEAIGRSMMLETVTALKLFVNDDVNELHFAIGEVARHFLKPVTGVLATIVSTDAESRVVKSVLQEADPKLYEDVNQMSSRSWVPWSILKPFPQELTAAEKTLNPRHHLAKLYAAQLKGD